MEDSTLSLLYIGFSILLFFLMRPIYLWYFNINKITEQQEEQIELTKKNNQFLEKLYLQLGGEIKNETKLGKKINDDDIAKIQELKIKLKADEIFVKTLQNGIIEKWKSSDWDDVVELGNSNKFEKLS